MCETRNSRLFGKITVFFVICCLVMGSFVVNTAVALNGSGTEGNPWRIESLDDFNDFAADANYWDDYTRLETDVNLAGITYATAVIAPDVSSSNYYQGTKYTGVFDGNDHKILNLTIDDGGAGNDFVGLFGNIDNGEVRNLGLEGGSVSGSGLAVGGLVGSTNEGTISNCYSTGDVNGGGSVGGLMGSAIYISVSNCHSTGDVSGTGDAIGGLAGYTLGIVSNCYSTGNVSGEWSVGGLMGSTQSSISNCYSTGDDSGDRNVGGLMGWNGGGVSNCYSTGDVQGGGDEEVGGLVGYHHHAGVISYCFWDIDSQTHGVTDSIGDEVGIVINLEGLPTHLLHQQSTFTDWDFINTWNIGENQTYPYLRVYLAGDINKDRIVNFLDIAITANQWLQEQ